MTKELTLREAQLEELLINQPELRLKEIADRLGISDKTADAHKTAVYRKRSVHTRVGLIHQAAMTGRLTANGNGA